MIGHQCPDGNILQPVKTKTKAVASPLLPLIQACQRQRGLKSRVLKMMMRRGINGNWANISEWLTPNVSKRRTPVPKTLAKMIKLQKEICR